MKRSEKFWTIVTIIILSILPFIWFELIVIDYFIVGLYLLFCFNDGWNQDESATSIKNRFNIIYQINKLLDK